MYVFFIILFFWSNLISRFVCVYDGWKISLWRVGVRSILSPSPNRKSHARIRSSRKFDFLPLRERECIYIRIREIARQLFREVLSTV